MNKDLLALIRMDLWAGLAVVLFSTGHPIGGTVALFFASLHFTMIFLKG